MAEHLMSAATIFLMIFGAVAEEYLEWKGYKRAEAKARHYEHGHWDVPWVTEDRAVRTTAEMMDHFSRLFQRTLRQLNGHRLAKLKAKKLQAEILKLNESEIKRGAIEAEDKE